MLYQDGSRDLQSPLKLLLAAAVLLLPSYLEACGGPAETGNTPDLRESASLGSYSVPAAATRRTPLSICSSMAVCPANAAQRPAAWRLPGGVSFSDPQDAWRLLLRIP